MTTSTVREAAKSALLESYQKVWGIAAYNVAFDRHYDQVDLW
jgi:hypothetical protein